MAASDHSLPPGIVARPLRERDLTAALALSLEAGWNQIAADWRIFLELGSVICLARGDGPPIATAATLPYAGGFAWISMVLVTAAERRQGLARWLLRHCVDDLLARKLVPVLDATPAGRTVYIGLGFQDCWTMHRLIGRTVRAPAAERGRGRRCDRSKRDDWPHVIAYDTAIFGADRSALLHRLADRLPQAALVAERDGRIAGFLLGRDGRVMSQLGPLAADDDGIASALLARAIAAVPAPLAVDVPDRHAALRRLAHHTRLCRGAAIYPNGLWNERGRSTIARDSSPSPGPNSAERVAIAQLQFGERNRLHLDRLVEEVVGVGPANVERLLQSDIGLHQIVGLVHSLRIEPAERHGLRGLVAHELLDLVPVDQLAVDLQAGIGLDQRLDARLGIGDAGREGLLRYLDESGDRVAMRFEDRRR